MTHANLDAKHGDDFVSPSAQALRDLHDAYGAFIAARPWQQIDDGHIVAHHHPEYGDAHTVVFGRLGQATGIHTFLGADGFRNAMTTLLGGPLHVMGMDHADEPALHIEEVDAIMALAGDRLDLSDPERREIRQAGLQYRGRGNWPFIRRATPGFIPCPVDEREARFAALVMRDVTNIAARIADQELDPSRWVNFENFLHSTFTDGEWRHEWYPRPRHAPDNPDTVHVSTDEIQAMPELSEPWLVGEATTHVAQEPAISHRPFPYRQQVIVNVRTGLTSAVSLPEGPVTYQQRQQMLHSAMKDSGGRPPIIVAHDPLTAVAIRPVCDEIDLPFAVATKRHHVFDYLEAGMH